LRRSASPRTSQRSLVFMLPPPFFRRYRWSRMAPGRHARGLLFWIVQSVLFFRYFGKESMKWSEKRGFSYLINLKIRRGDLSHQEDRYSLRFSKRHLYKSPKNNNKNEILARLDCFFRRIAVSYNSKDNEEGGF